jgi:hypothetical protein
MAFARQGISGIMGVPGMTLWHLLYLRLYPTIIRARKSWIRPRVLGIMEQPARPGIMEIWAMGRYRLLSLSME